MAQEQTILEQQLSFKAAFMASGLQNIVLTSCTCGLWLLKVLLDSKGNSIKITSERLIWTHGLIAKKDEEIEFMRVKDSSYSQDIIGRLANVGTIRILSTDLSSPSLTFPIESPKEWREKIREIVKAEKERKGIKYEEKI